ncbi:hypothetical protein Taro_044046 [Colocasia esculenta]|uniref:Uncharacterized protein n=1 Tax=Colocasia esculenta TaxID=4460 RepID=A0A843X013_COLES|nr:hypothetical protein [Colocasia esculenta]
MNCSPSESPDLWVVTAKIRSSAWAEGRETYDKTMVDRYAEGTPQLDLDLEAWVDAAGGPRKGRVYGFGDSLDTTPVLSSHASSVAPPTYVSSSATPLGSGVEEMRTLIQEELRTHFGVMFEQLISAMQGVCLS